VKEELTEFQITCSAIDQESFSQGGERWLCINSLRVELHRFTESLALEVFISLLFEVLGNFWLR